jgi:hypothetical protein
MNEAIEFTFDIEAEAIVLRKQRMSEARRHTTKQIQKMKKRLALVIALSEVGLIEKSAMSNAVRYGRQIEVKSEQLPMVRRVLMSCGLTKEQSRLEDKGNYTLISKENRTIYVNLTCEALEYLNIRFYYEGILDPSAKCQITTHSYDTISCTV